MEKTVEPTSKEELQASNFNSNNDIKTSMFDVIEEGLNAMVRPGRALHYQRLKCAISPKTKSVADVTVQTVLSNKGFIVPIAETVGKLVDRAVDDCHLHDIKKASRTTADINLSIQRPLLRPKMPSSMLSGTPYFDSQEGNRRKRRCLHTSSCCNHQEI